MTSSERAGGGCACGAVRYSAEQARMFKPYACHCSDCQTRSGGAFTVQIIVPPEALAIEGELIEGRSINPSGAEVRQYACKHCLTRIYGANLSRPGTVILRAGTLDASQAPVSAVHLWTRSKQAWVVIPEDVPSYPTQPENAMDWIAPLVPLQS